jgi:1,2-diacylglycerol 3-alpha-glucosyltransferase
MATDRYRVGLFTDSYVPSPNGVANSVYLTQRELNRLGHDAWVIAPQHPEAPPQEDRVLRYPSAAYPFFDEYRISLPLGPRLPRFDLIHTHTPITLGIWGNLVAHRRRIPHITTYHTHIEGYTHYVPGATAIDRRLHLARRIVRAFYNRADLILAPSHAIGFMLAEYRLTPPVEVIPTGIDLDLLDHAPVLPGTDHAPWPQGARRILTVSRLGKEKDLPVLLQAIATIARDTDVHLLVIGTGPDEADLRLRAAALGIAQRVTFLGRIPYKAIGAYFRRAEVFALPSATETQSLVLLEAAASAVPTLAVRALGAAEQVEDGETGYLTEPGDTPAFTARLATLLADHDLRRRMGEAGRRLAERKSTAAAAQRLTQTYGRAIATHHR